MSLKKIIVSCLFCILYINTYSQFWHDRKILNDDTITFEIPCSFLKPGTAEDDIWLIGEPGKTFFNSAYSGDKAIMTGIAGSYPVNNHSWFDIVLEEFKPEWFFDEFPYDVYVEFHHKLDTDSLHDGGYITVSYDQGETWMNIIEDTIYPEAKPEWENGNLYSRDDVLFNGEKGFSGRSEGWETVWFAWHYIPVKKAAVAEGVNSMIIRFNFISDDINNNKEGWLIDNIRLFSIDLGSGIPNRKIREAVRIYPNPVNQSTVIDLNTRHHEVTISLVDVTGRLMYTMKYTNTGLIPLDTERLSKGIYFVRIGLDTSGTETHKIVVE